MEEISPQDESHAIAPQRQTSILVVDDNAINRKVLTGTLEKVGYTIACAHDGLEAIRMLSEATYSLVLMDLRMPGLDGIDTTTRIRTELSTEIPIIGVTAGMGDGEEDRFRASGANSILLKPIDTRELMDCIEAILGPRTPMPEEDDGLGDLRKTMFG